MGEWGPSVSETDQLANSNPGGIPKLDGVVPRTDLTRSDVAPKSDWRQLWNYDHSDILQMCHTQVQQVGAFPSFL
jgi:hypothetical protein